MNLIVHFLYYAKKDIRVYVLDRQIYVDANDLLDCANTSLEAFLSAGDNSAQMEEFERMANLMLTVLNPNGRPFFVAHPTNPKETLLSQVAAYHILSQTGAVALNKWFQRECFRLGELLDGL